MCTAQHSTAQHSTAQHSTAQHSTAQHASMTNSSHVNMYPKVCAGYIWFVTSTADCLQTVGHAHTTPSVAKCAYPPDENKVMSTLLMSKAFLNTKQVIADRS